MSRMTTHIRAIACGLVLVVLSGCASMYGKGKDPDANRLGAAPTVMHEVAMPTR